MAIHPDDLIRSKKVKGKQDPKCVWGPDARYFIEGCYFRLHVVGFDRTDHQGGVTTPDNTNIMLSRNIFGRKIDHEKPDAPPFHDEYFTSDAPSDIPEVISPHPLRQSSESLHGKTHKNQMLQCWCSDYYQGE